MKQVLIGATLLLLWVGLAACVPVQALPLSQPQVVDGVLDLRQWDFEQDGVVRLNGEWEFFWKQLLTSDDFAGTNPPAMTGLITVPGSWRGYEVNGQYLGSHGYATYRLTVLIDPATLPEELLAVKIPVPLNTAHRLYVDGQLLGSAGQVGTTAEAMTPQSKPYIAPFAPAGEQVEILLQLSNFHHYEGGILFDSIMFGPQAQVVLLNEQKLGRDLFLIGSLFIIGVYHLGLFSLRRKEKAPLYFGLFCLLIAGAMLVTNRSPIFAHYISQSWAVMMRSRLLLPVVAINAFALFVQALFPQEYSRGTLRVIVGVGTLLIAVFLLASMMVVTALPVVLVFYIGAIHTYNIAVVLMAAGHKRDGTMIFLAGYFFLILASINDVLFFFGLIQTGQLIGFGLFIFIFAQAYLLSVRFANAFTQTETLSEELRRSEQKYRTIFEDSKDVVFIASFDGRIEAVNPACFEVLGYNRDEVLGMDTLDFYVNPADQPRFQDAITQAGAVKDFSLQLRHKQGHTLACQITATLRHDEASQIIGYQGIIHDMTAYKQAEAARQRVLALQGLNQTLEQRVEARTTALTEANTALQAEIEQRRSHQQEKDRLLELAQQQSEHLRAMSGWLVEIQHNQRQNQSIELDTNIQQKMTDIRQNLNVLQSAAILEQDFALTTHIADTIRLLAEMEIYLEQVTSSMDESISQEDPLADNLLLQLSSRERQVLRLMAEGKSNPEIADILTIRLNTVHTYLKRIRHKLDIQDIPGLIEFARNNGLLE